MSETTKNRVKQRPLSPHLFIYKPQITSVLSILHRMTGVALIFGLVLFTWFLAAAASGVQAFNFFMDFARSPLGMLMIFGWTFALYYHMCNGVRHLIWDMGYLLKLKSAKSAGNIVVLSAILLTVLSWFLVMTNAFG